MTTLPANVDSPLSIEEGLLSVKAVSRRLRIAQQVVREAVARGLIDPVEAKARPNDGTGVIEWDYRFSPEAVEELGVWLRAHAHSELQVQDEFEFGIRKRLYNYNLRAARLRLGLTLNQLARKIKVSGSTIGHWENLRGFPSVAQRQAAANALGLPIDSLFPDWLVEFKLEKGPSIITDGHFSLERAIAAGIDLPSLPAPGEEALLKAAVAEVLSTLTEREQLVLRRRYGLDSDDGTRGTLKEVGKTLGVTQERIRQIEAKAFRKLRHPVRARKLQDFLE